MAREINPRKEIPLRRTLRALGADIEQRRHELKESSKWKLGEATKESVQEFAEALSVLIADRQNVIQKLWTSIDAGLQYLLAI